MSRMNLIRFSAESYLFKLKNTIRASADYISGPFARNGGACVNPLNYFVCTDNSGN